MNRLAIAIVVAGALAPAMVQGQVGEVLAPGAAEQVVRNFEATDLTGPAGNQCLGDQVQAALTGWEPAPEEAASRARGKKGKKGKDSCKFAKDGECDEPDLCDPGTDTTDCFDEDEEEYDDEDIDDEDDEDNDRRSRRGKLYCCDNYGRAWCEIVVNPGPVGSPCWCAGVPGSGTMCRR